MQLELLLLFVSILFFVSIIADKAGYRFGVPALLLFLAVGMLFGNDGLGFSFDNLYVTQTIGTVALCVILFSGGLDTRIADIKPVIRQGIVLSTVGVLLMTILSGFAIWLVFSKIIHHTEFTLLTALLLAATMSSTDSASVFSILRTKNLRLKNNLKPMLELESGSNDPMAYVLTITLLSIIQSGSVPNYLAAFLLLCSQLIIGGAAGFFMGKLVVLLVNKINIKNDSLYPILGFSSCIFIFSSTYFLQGNSYLAVYIGGLVIGNSKIVHKNSTVRFFDGITWLSQLTMFLTLGLFVSPHELLDVLVPGLIISFITIFITRPLSVFISLLPFKNMHARDKAFISWVGLRGAVPIIFALMSLEAEIPNAQLIFNTVFLCTLVSLILQGTSLPTVARFLHLVGKSPKIKKTALTDIDFSDEIKSVATEIVITKDMLKSGNRLMDIGFPEKTLVIMVKRENEGFFVPTGKNILKENDILLVITDNVDELEHIVNTDSTESIEA